MANSTYTNNSGSLPGGRDMNDFVYDPSFAEVPKDTRFRPGQSGNPTGRPPGSKNKPKVLNNVLLTEMKREELSRLVEVNDGNEVECISLVKSIMRKRLAAADAGNDKAQLWAIEAVREVEAADAKEREADFVYAEIYKKRPPYMRIGGSVRRR